jgi:hypothetical protein
VRERKKDAREDMTDEREREREREREGESRISTSAERA